MRVLPKASDALPSQSQRLHNYFFVQKYSFAAIGIDPTSEVCTIYSPWRIWIPLAAIVTVCGPVFIFASQYVNDLDKMANILAPIWPSILAIVKFILFMWNHKKIVSLVRQVWLWNLKANQEELEILAEENRYDTRVSVFYYSSVFVSAVMATLLPLVIATFYSWKGYGFWENLDPPFKGVYFVDPRRSYLTYIFIFIWNALGIYYVLNGTLAIDTLFSWFMRNISGQFRILHLRFKLTADKVRERQALHLDHEQLLTQALIDCMQYHCRVRELAENFNEIYKHIVFIKFLISCVQIALVTFQFPNTTEMAIQAFNVSFMVSVSTQLMLYCHGGQRIKNLVRTLLGIFVALTGLRKKRMAMKALRLILSFMNLSNIFGTLMFFGLTMFSFVLQSSSLDAIIYESFQWHNLSVKSQKLLMLPMLRSQKPCHLKGIFFVVDLSLFVWVFKTAGSFLTMMLSMDQVE